MTYRVVPLLVFAAGAAWTAAADDAPDAPIDLLDSRAPWVEVNTDPEVFTVGNGALTADRRTYQSATLLTRQDYENFELSFEFLVKEWCELILVMHAPRNEAWRAGLELVLSDHAGSSPSPHAAGALLREQAPTTVAMNEDGEWNTCAITMDWPAFKVVLNGETVQDLDLQEHPSLRYKLHQGALGFRDLLGWGFQVRNMHLTPLPDSENAVTLFGGDNLDGWREVRPGRATFTVQDGLLVADDGNGYLQHEYKVQDFDLRLYYRTTPVANGGVFFRWMTDDSDRGNEIQLLDVPQTIMPSASIYGLARAGDAPIRAGGWNLLQIRVDGNHAITHLNGVKTAETTELTKIRPGHITLQMHRERATIKYKDIVLVPRD